MSRSTAGREGVPASPRIAAPVHTLNCEPWAGQVTVEPSSVPSFMVDSVVAMVNYASSSLVTGPPCVLLAKTGERALM